MPARSLRLALLVALTLVPAALVGCTSSPRTPCQVLKQNKWTCNIDVVDALEPGQIVYVKDGVFQPLPIRTSPPHCVETNAVREMGKSTWSFGLSAGVPQIPGLSAVADAKAAVSASGAKTVDISFPTVSVCSLTTGEDGTALADIERAKEAARRYLEALTLPDRTAVVRESRRAQVTVYLILQTLSATVDATVNHASGFSTDVGATIHGVKAAVSGGHTGDRTLVMKYASPVPIAYRALPILIGPAGLEGAAPLTVPPSAAFEPIRK